MRWSEFEGKSRLVAVLGECRGRLKSTFLLLVIVVLSFDSSASLVAAAPLRLGVLGDSISAGNGSDFGSNPNWVTQLSKSGAFSVGKLGNQAVGGATSTDVLNDQLPAIQAQVAAGQLDYSVLLIGANDAAYAAADYLDSGDLDSTIQTLIGTVVGNVKTILTSVAAAGSVHQIVATVPDQTVSPLVKSLFTQYNATPAQIASIRSGIQTINSEIKEFALARNIPVIDLFTSSDDLTAVSPLTLAGVNYTSVFASDGYHPAAVSHGLIANMVIDAANRQFHAGALRISDQQIVRNTGRTPRTVGPTYFNVSPYTLLAVPEPSSAALAGIGAVLFVAFRCAMSQRTARD